MTTLEAANHVKGIAESKETKETARTNPKNFTRKRSLPFVNLLYFLLNPAKECLQVKLNNFFKIIGNGVIHITQQALSKELSNNNLDN